MYGFLTPSSGGQAVALRKQRLFFGRSRGGDASGPPDESNAFCRLELIDGWWHIEDLNCPQGLRVNGCPCKRIRLNPNDEIAIGRHRYRITFEAPRYPLGRRHGAQTGGGAASPRRASRSPQLAGQPGGVLGRLIPTGGGQDIALHKPRVTIGRRPPCDIVLKHPTVSSRHCELQFVDGYWRVEDLGSHNGIRVDGVPCTSAWVLPQSRLAIADHQYELSYTGIGPAPSPQTVESGPRKSLMAKLGVSEGELDQAVRQESVRDVAEPEKRRWDITDEE